MLLLRRVSIGALILLGVQLQVMALPSEWLAENGSSTIEPTTEVPEGFAAIALSIADSFLQCGVYYQYTARGMGNNANIARDAVSVVENNADILLQSADVVYRAFGLSTREKYDAFMAQANRIVAAYGPHSEQLSALIYQRGQVCSGVVSSYEERLGEVRFILENY